MCRSVLQCVAACYSALQYVAVDAAVAGCSVLPRVAESFSVLQCVEWTLPSLPRARSTALWGDTVCFTHIQVPTQTQYIHTYV